MDEAFYESLLDRISDGVYYVDRNRLITYWNTGAQELTGYSREEVLGRSCAEGFLRHVNERGTQLCLHGCPLAAVMNDGRERSVNVYLHHKEGHRIPIKVSGQALRDQDGMILGSVEVFSSRVVSPYAAVERRAKPDDGIDPVTGLPARGLGEATLETMVSAVRHGSASLGVLFIDADRFKDVNDTYGHRTGDQVLRMLGQSLANALRRRDVPIRWGGEEFVALLPGTDEAGLARAAERVRMLVENSWLQLGESQVRVTVSVGATMATAQDQVDGLIERADRFMYRSKKSGRNLVTVEGAIARERAETPLVGCGIPWAEVAPVARR